ncbi:MAG: endonuclease III [Candidatus Handelsmanbacteria bacterium RIFCSPLOWO2_12_FULL_64_10]|uniref:Endonuclease III n=1 Tax=Handelsmanbacteria sp. (strain RIFCSPLOWO2_12_FULL_64_10) TaxID=1817868 RepID=A0A1F6D5C6_HANXR|nr:MAG: endonuclease III [Candidatus Handelsmanbacteria bacterium RIFCSPLOWO2_12_FULL_64_10]
METLEDKKKRARRVIAGLRKAFPDAKCSLDYENPLQLLIATILSAQCTDERVNAVTPALFARYRTAQDFADAPVEEIEGFIRSTGFFRNKAKNIQACCEGLAREHGGEVPRDMEALTRLAGVGRKTANVVLGNAFGIASGVVVDTHVRRITHRLGLTRHQDPEKIEQDLVELIPKKDWVDFSHLLIHHGRRTCEARSPDCPACPINRDCPSRQT